MNTGGWVDKNNFLATEEYDKNVAVNHTSTEKMGAFDIEKTSCDLWTHRKQTHNEYTQSCQQIAEEDAKQRLGEKLHSLAAFVYDRLWASVMKAVPKLDESESSQMVLK